MSKKYKYPCTRHIKMNGFGSFLEEESKGSRLCSLEKLLMRRRDRFDKRML